MDHNPALGDSYEEETEEKRRARFYEAHIRRVKREQEAVARRRMLRACTQVKVDGQEEVEKKERELERRREKQAKRIAAKKEKRRMIAEALFQVAEKEMVEIKAERGKESRRKHEARRERRRRRKTEALKKAVEEDLRKKKEVKVAKKTVTCGYKEDLANPAAKYVDGLITEGSRFNALGTTPIGPINHDVATTTSEISDDEAEPSVPQIVLYSAYAPPTQVVEADPNFLVGNQYFLETVRVNGSRRGAKINENTNKSRKPRNS
jgi:hypothetical protein